MRNLIGRPVLAVGETVYSWEDVILAAALWGDWSRVVERTSEGLALVAEAEAAESDEPPFTDEEVEEAASEFRYARNLVSADEMEAWLSAWGLDVDGWMQWIVTDVLRTRSEAAEGEDAGAGDEEAAPEGDDAQALAEPGDGEPEEEGEPDEEFLSALHAEAVCSGTLGRLSYSLAQRAAVFAREREEGGPAAAEAREGPAPEVPAALPPLGLAPEEVTRRLRALSELDAAFERFRARVVDADQLAARLRSRQTDWTRVTVRVLKLDSEDAAREALTSVRDDGCDLSEVAADAGVELAEGTTFLEELDSGVRDRLLAAQKGELLGPLKDGEGWSLFEVLDKTLPSLEDEEIAEKAEKSLLQSALSREVDNRVVWRWRS